MKRGFTLIELLVVVLIIGILSAVALPQYTKAVEKSRAAEALQILRYMHQQKEIYKLENGEGGATAPNEDVGIELGNGFNCLFKSSDDEICCNKHWCYENSGILYGDRCVGFWGNVVAIRVDNATPSSLGEKTHLYYLQYESSPCVESPRIVCYGAGDTDWCKMFKGDGNPI